MDETVEPTDQDFRIALTGLWMQARVHGVEITWEVRAFLLQQAEVSAADSAFTRFHRNIIHDYTFSDRG